MSTNLKWILVFFISMVPLIELRGAIPFAQGFGLPIVPSYIVAVIGNMIPVPIIYLFARKVLDWLGKRYPKKGDRVDGRITFVNWDWIRDKKLDCGAFVLYSIKFSGGPLTASFGCLASPIDSDFNARDRTKTYKDVTIEEIAQGIADRYYLKLKYSGADIRIDTI